MAGQDVTAREQSPVTDRFRSFREWTQAACTEGQKCSLANGL